MSSLSTYVGCIREIFLLACLLVLLDFLLKGIVARGEAGGIAVTRTA